MALTAGQTPAPALITEYIGTVSAPLLLAESILEAADAVATLVDQITAAVAAGRRPAAYVPPDSLVRRAVLEMTADLYNRKSAPNGVRHFPGADGVTPVRIARDPAASARAILADYLPVGLA